MTLDLAALIAKQTMPHADPVHVEVGRLLVEYQRENGPSGFDVMAEDIRICILVNALQQMGVPATQHRADLSIGWSTQPHLHGFRIGRQLFGLKGESTWSELLQTRLSALPARESFKDSEIKPIKPSYNLYQQLSNGPQASVLKTASAAFVAWMESLQLQASTPAPTQSSKALRL